MPEQVAQTVAESPAAGKSATAKEAVSNAQATAASLTNDVLSVLGNFLPKTTASAYPAPREASPTVGKLYASQASRIMRDADKDADMDELLRMAAAVRKELFFEITLNDIAATTTLLEEKRAEAAESGASNGSAPSSPPAEGSDTSWTLQAGSMPLDAQMQAYRLNA